MDDDKKEGRKKAVVVNPRLDLCSRQIFMHEEFKDLVEVYKIRDHFICEFNKHFISTNFSKKNNSYIFYYFSFNRVNRSIDCRRGVQASRQNPDAKM